MDDDGVKWRLKNTLSQRGACDTTSRGVQRRLRSLRAVLTRVACARHDCSCHSF